MAKKNVKRGINMEKLNQIDKELEVTMKDVQVRGVVEGSEMVEPTIPEEVMNELVKETEEMEMKRIADMEEYFEDLRQIEEDMKARKELEEEMMNETTSVEYTSNLVKEINEYTEQKTKEANQEMIILNREIKRALAFSKGKGVRGITGKQMKAIVEGYKRVIGCDMNDEQIAYMRTITDVQAESVIRTIVAYTNHLRNQARLASC